MSRSQPDTLRSVLAAVVAGLAPLRAEPPMRLSEWARKHFRLSAESSHVSGEWRPWPFQIGWMDAFSNDDIREVVVRKAKRVGYTKTLVAFIAYNAAHRRRKQAVYQPTDDDRDSFVKTEIDPMLRDVEAVRPVLVQGKEDTIKLKTFLGSLLHLLGGKAARAYRRITVAIAIIDEADAFDQKVEKAIDPMTAAEGRLEGAPFPKFIVGGTVRLDDMSHVQNRERRAQAVMRYRITCRHCEADHPLLWGGKDVAHGFKWDGADPQTVRHVCPHCRGTMSQAEYLREWDAGPGWVSDCGRWRYDHHAGVWLDASGAPCKPPEKVAFVECWTAYSPQRSWPDIVSEFLAAHAKHEQGDDGPLETFKNETLAQYWKVEMDRSDENALQQRAEAYALRTVPQGGLVLVAGVDVQDNRWEIVVWAIGRGEEMWVVDYYVIFGNPADEREWDAPADPEKPGFVSLERYLSETTFQHAGGQQLKIEAAAVDTGGHFTHQAYNFCRTRERRRIYAVKGDDKPSKMVKGKATIQDVNWRGKVLKRGVRLWYVGTDTAKDLLHGRLRVTQPGAGFVHFSKFLPKEFYEQLTAEARLPTRTARGLEFKWVNPKRARNEVLDCTVYAIFCTHQLALHMYTDPMWTRLERALEPDLFAAAADAGSQEAVPPSPPLKEEVTRATRPTFRREW